MGLGPWGPAADGWAVNQFYEGRLTAFPLIRIRPGRKAAQDKGWSSLKRIGDLDQWRERLKGWYGPLGLVTGAGHAVVDVDAYHDGVAERFGQLVTSLSLGVKTTTVHTPRGGLHFHYLVDPALTLRSGPIPGFEGVDFKSAGGYVLVPHSVGYEPDELYGLDSDPLQLPAGLVALMARGARKDTIIDSEANEQTARLLTERFGATVFSVDGDGCVLVTRPEGDVPKETAGASGSVGSAGPGKFMCFSTNWPPFTTVHPYTYHDLLGLLGERPKVDTSRLRPADDDALRLRRGHTISMEAVEWLWTDRLPLGVLTLLAGREGTGKGILASWLSARVSRGTLTGRHEGEPHSVLWIGTEDNLSTTIVPRWKAAGADLRRLNVLTLPDGSDASELAADRLDEVAELVVAERIALVVLDPLISLVPLRLDAFKEQHSRAALTPLRNLAELTGATLLGLTHFGKGHGNDALTAVLNSRAFTAAARAVLVVGFDPEEDPPFTRVVVVRKSNVGRLDLPGFAYTVTEKIVGLDDQGRAIRAGELIELGEREAPPSAESMMRPGEQEPRSAREEAKEFLLGMLGAGEVLAEDVKRQADREGVAGMTLRRAKTDAGVVVRRDGFGPGSKVYWSLPEEDS